MSTRALAEYAALVRYEELPEPVLRQARLLLLDYLGVALHDGEGQAAQFTEAKIRDAAILATAQRVRTELFPAMRPNHQAHLSVRLRDGRMIAREVLAPTGSSDVPMSEENRRAKFRALAAVGRSIDRIAEVERTVDGLDDLTGIGALTALLV
ncbi:MAG: MmgE/PrpD family protein [Chloroflexi bacterium]|nr:MmgE/PrpD family protein [Chloroflexota bacterium]